MVQSCTPNVSSSVSTSFFASTSKVRRGHVHFADVLVVAGAPCPGATFVFGARLSTTIERSDASAVYPERDLKKT